MKKYLYIIVFILTFVGCAGPRQEDAHESIQTKFYVTEITKAKHSRVSGYITYNGIRIPASNGSSGYYYKEYNLREGQVIDVNVGIIRQYEYNRVTLITTDVDLRKYEK